MWRLLIEESNLIENSKSCVETSQRKLHYPMNYVCKYYRFCPFEYQKGDSDVRSSLLWLLDTQKGRINRRTNYPSVLVMLYTNLRPEPED